MATKAEKQQLMDTLKFTPTPVRMLIQGYGGEAYAGIVDRKIYDFFKHKQIDLDEYAGDWDGIYEQLVPGELQPFSPGSPYDCDDLWHCSGAEMSELNEILVEETDSGKTVWVGNCGVSDLEDAGVVVGEGGGTELDDLDPGTVVFWGGQGEKGCFFDGEFVLKAPFDPKKLNITYENCDGWYLISTVEYDGEEIDGTGGYSTTGKWAEHKWVIVGQPDEGYESISRDADSVEEESDEWTDFVSGIEKAVNQELENKKADFDPVAELDKILIEFEDDDKTDWIPSKIKPVHVGTYECQVNKIPTWPWPNEAMLTWTGKHWQDEDGEKVGKPFAWRGLKEKAL